MIEDKEPSKRDTAHRAYKLYVQRGGEHGKDVEDWIRAEQELKTDIAAGSLKTKVAQAGRS
jgi:hypothetical protein